MSDHRSDPLDSERQAPLASAERRPHLNALGEERPAFLLEFPDDPELGLLVRAFEDGNFAQVRRDAPELARRTSDAAVRRAALELRQRIDPDPLLVVLLLFSLSLFAIIVAWIYAQ
jgi:hypothetical protein